MTPKKTGMKTPMMMTTTMTGLKSRRKREKEKNLETTKKIMR